MRVEPTNPGRTREQPQYRTVLDMYRTHTCLVTLLHPGYTVERYETTNARSVAFVYSEVVRCQAAVPRSRTRRGGFNSCRGQNHGPIAGPKTSREPCLAENAGAASFTDSRGLLLAKNAEGERNAFRMPENAIV